MNQPNSSSRRPNFDREQPKEFEEKVIQVNRVSKKTKGGNRINFSVLMVVGDRQGRVGVGLGKSPSVLSSIEKGIRRAKKRLIQVPIKNGTIPFPITVKKGAAKLLLKPAPEGTGIIAGGAVRAVVDAAGIRNIVSKTIGGSNQASNVYATFEALQQIRLIADVKGIKLERPGKPTTPLQDRSFRPAQRPNFSGQRPAAKPTAAPVLAKPAAKPSVQPTTSPQKKA